MTASPTPRAWYRVLYVQVLLAMLVGILLGHFFPNAGMAMKPLGDGFVALIRMMIAPIVFCTVVQGIGSMSDMRKVGRVGVKALVYFELVSTLAPIIGLIVASVAQPGKGLNIDPSAFDPKAVAGYVSHVKDVGLVSRLLAIIPDTFVAAFVQGDVLQILLIAILTGFAVSRL